MADPLEEAEDEDEAPELDWADEPAIPPNNEVSNELTADVMAILSTKALGAEYPANGK